MRKPQSALPSGRAFAYVRNSAVCVPQAIAYRLYDVRAGALSRSAIVGLKAKPTTQIKQRCTKWSATQRGSSNSTAAKYGLRGKRAQSIESVRRKQGRSSFRTASVPCFLN